GVRLTLQKNCMGDPAPQAARHLGNIRLTSSDSGSRQALVFWIQIATNEPTNALQSFRGQWPRTSEFDIHGGCVFEEQSLEFLIARSRFVYNLREYDLQPREYALLPILGQGNLFIEQPQGKHSEALGRSGAPKRIARTPLLKARMSGWFTVSHSVALPLNSCARSRLQFRVSRRRRSIILRLASSLRLRPVRI